MGNNKQALTIYKMSSTLAFNTHVENRTSCFIVCPVHLDLILMAETKYLCASERESDFYFMSLSRRYCEHCGAHYLRKVHKNVPFLGLVLGFLSI